MGKRRKLALNEESDDSESDGEYLTDGETLDGDPLDGDLLDGSDSDDDREGRRLRIVVPHRIGLGYAKIFEVPGMFAVSQRVSSAHAGYIRTWW